MLVDAAGDVLHAESTLYRYRNTPASESSPSSSTTTIPPSGRCAAWAAALARLLASVPPGLLARTASVAVDATSGTVLLVDESLPPLLALAEPLSQAGRAGAGSTILAAPVMYNESAGAEALAALRRMAPPGHTVLSETSGLAKLVAWTLPSDAASGWGRAGAIRPRLAHQADWLASLLHGGRVATDANNALKTGYDPARLGAEGWPAWLRAQPQLARLLPEVVLQPGEVRSGRGAAPAPSGWLRLAAARGAHRRGAREPGPS